MRKKLLVPVVAGIACLASAGGVMAANTTKSAITMQDAVLFAYGQTNQQQTPCQYTGSTSTIFCTSTNPPSMTFTATKNGVCTIEMDGQVLNNSGQSTTGGAEVQYGIADYTKVTGDVAVDPNDISTTLGTYNPSGTSATVAAALSRAYQVPVTKGTTYTFGYWIKDAPGNAGTAYVNETYSCLS